MAQVTIRQGDCVSSIAHEHGLFWETIWNAPENSELKRLRVYPNVLKPGDTLFVPDRREGSAGGATEQQHRFRRKGVPAFLRLRMVRPDARDEESPAVPELPGDQPEEDSLDVTVEDEPPDDVGPDVPWADAPYWLDIDGATTEGRTDGDGRLEVPISPLARQGRLTMEPGTQNERVFMLRLGWLDPEHTISGVAERLANLGFFEGERPEEMTAELEGALRAFQEANGLEPTGDNDQATRDRLSELHGS